MFLAPNITKPMIRSQRSGARARDPSLRWMVVAQLLLRDGGTPAHVYYWCDLRNSAKTLISIRSSQEIFRVLSRELRAFVNFYALDVGIYDECL
jgi:hypothetical protein